MKRNPNTITAVMCLVLSLLMPTTAFALAPASSGQDAVSQKHQAFTKYDMQKEAKELAQMLADDLRTLQDLPRILLGLTDFENFLPTTLLIDRENGKKIYVFLNKYNSDGKFFTPIEALIQELTALYANYGELTTHISKIYEHLRPLFQAIINQQLDTAEFDSELWELSGHRFETIGDALEYWTTATDLLNPVIRIRILPELTHDIEIINDVTFAPNLFLIAVKSMDALNFLNERSEYMAALCVFMLFPDIDIPDYYDMVPEDTPTPRFSPFIRLFYDYAERAENGIDMTMPYNEYRQKLKQKKTKPDYNDMVRSQQMRDKKDYFRLLDLTPENNIRDIRVSYQTLRRKASPALISPRAPVWFETQIRNQQMYQADKAYEMLGNPYNRINYDPFFRKANPEIVVEAAA